MSRDWLRADPPPFGSDEKGKKPVQDKHWGHERTHSAEHIQGTDIHSANTEEGPCKDQSPPSPTEAIRVLVVGDDMGDISAAKLRLRRYKGRRFEVVVAHKPEDAEAIGKRFCPHVLLMSGWPSQYVGGGVVETLTRVRASVPNAKTIAVTNGKPEEEYNARSLGAQEVLDRRHLGSSWLLPKTVLGLVG